MGITTNAPALDKAPDAHGSHGEGGEAHATLSGYLTGFGLSVVLTAVPFWLVMARPIEDGVTTALLVVSLAVAQIFVHMIYFLHMDAKSEGGWTIMALIFTAVLVIITISGSLWVMFHLNRNMMPMGDMQMEEPAERAPINQLAPIGGGEDDEMPEAPMPPPLPENGSAEDAAGAPASEPNIQNMEPAAESALEPQASASQRPQAPGSGSSEPATQPEGSANGN
ncbi:Prokaryotic Cytochrome C oxidase subunit IV [Fulvimarina pelagi HTCC2506]|uniref:Cytochrome bo(3) ubiquinol oxidase subunit 4 n=1 Tax=Fulvimarina pelagi HTCC2506 TaxID=314231 RepID=Q0FXJ6_9HYPH|nr:Prokaryotic Cytochrome C oxidase subunit IV [Fulvimarina pelagi HTCC2506]